MALAYLVGSVTQGSNDAYAEAEIATALQGIGNVSFRVREILFELPFVLDGDGEDIQIALTRRTKTAMPLITDRDVIAKYSRGVQLVTSGVIVENGVVRFTYTEDDDVRIVEDPVYLQVDSTATAATNTVYCRIGYERASISAVDRLTLLTQSLE